MTESELGQMLQSIDAALEVFRSHKGPLTALEISAKSMLIAVRVQVVDQLSRERVAARKLAN